MKKLVALSIAPLFMMLGACSSDDSNGSSETVVAKQEATPATVAAKLVDKYQTDFTNYGATGSGAAPCSGVGAEFGTGCDPVIKKQVEIANAVSDELANSDVQIAAVADQIATVKQEAASWNEANCALPTTYAKGNTNSLKCLAAQMGASAAFMLINVELKKAAGVK